jgi:tRNA(adenine34) deaminase
MNPMPLPEQDDIKKIDERFMKMALDEAKKAFDAGEVPVGCVVVCQNKVIARAHNFTERLRDFTAHAEMQAFTSAAEYLGGKYLSECTLYVTLEPCMMCAGASFLSRVKRIVYGASDLKRGYSLFQRDSHSLPLLHPSCDVTTGILADECSELLSTFFREKREG